MMCVLKDENKWKRDRGLPNFLKRMNEVNLPGHNKKVYF